MAGFWPLRFLSPFGNPHLLLLTQPWNFNCCVSPDFFYAPPLYTRTVLFDFIPTLFSAVHLLSSYPQATTCCRFIFTCGLFFLAPHLPSKSSNVFAPALGSGILLVSDSGSWRIAPRVKVNIFPGCAWVFGDFSVPVLPLHELN